MERVFFSYVSVPQQTACFDDRRIDMKSSERAMFGLEMTAFMWCKDNSIWFPWFEAVRTTEEGRKIQMMALKIYTDAKY